MTLVDYDYLIQLIESINLSLAHLLAIVYILLGVWFVKFIFWDIFFKNI